MRKLFVCFVVVALALVSTSAKATIVADIGGDYTGPTAEPAGWDYLESTAATGGTETALTPSTVVGNQGSTGFGGSDTFALGAVLGDNANLGAYEMFGDGNSNHPSATPGVDLLVHPGGVLLAGSPPFVIARYTISAADVLNGTTATVAGSYESLLGGTSTIDFFVFHNSTDLLGGAGLGTHSGTIAPASFTVAAGDTISFVVGSGASLGGDETGIRGTVDLVPEPYSIMLILMSTVGLGLLRRRRR